VPLLQRKKSRFSLPTKIHVWLIAPLGRKRPLRRSIGFAGGQEQLFL